MGEVVGREAGEEGTTGVGVRRLVGRGVTVPGSGVTSGTGEGVISPGVGVPGEGLGVGLGVGTKGFS